MHVMLTCKICGKEFTVPHWRLDKAKYCSKTCAAKGARAEPNVICTQCGKPFHLKPTQITKYVRKAGYFCSRKCFAQYKVKSMSGKGNHQYGLKGPLNASFKGGLTRSRNNRLTDLKIYVPDHPFRDSCGRVVYHRLIVEQNQDKFDPKYFIEIGGKKYLSPDFCVHHIDLDHNNNEVSNLAVVTKSEHRSIHNRLRAMPRDAITGRFICRSSDSNNIPSSLSDSDRGTGGFGSTGNNMEAIAEELQLVTDVENKKRAVGIRR